MIFALIIAVPASALGVAVRTITNLIFEKYKKAQPVN
jgi:hypothetical protein